MDIIQKLATCDLGREIYHSDGEGHVQVEYQYQADLTDPFDTPQLLIGQVEQESLWSEFFEMAKTKEDDWILRFTQYLPDTAHYSTMCFIEFLSTLSSRDMQIVLIQDSPLWLWDKKNAPMIGMVIDKARQLIDSTPRESMDKEIDLSILNGVISRLETKRNKIE